MKVLRAILTHLRVKAKMNNLNLKLPQLRRPLLRRSKRRPQRKLPARKPRRSKKAMKALNLARKVAMKLKKEGNKPNKIAAMSRQTLVQMMNKSKENPKSDDKLTVGLFLNS